MDIIEPACFANQARTVDAPARDPVVKGSGLENGEPR
jgi:hypothetical protein